MERQDDTALVRLAEMVADGEAVDWDAEAERTPQFRREIRHLRWLEAIAIARRIGIRMQAAPSRSGRMESASAAAAPAGPPTGAPEREPLEAPPSPEPLAPGTTWGSLQIRGRIGQGAAGDVYRAFDPRLGREVALKIWRERGGYRTTGTEARRLGRIRHPRVLSVLGYERHDGFAGMWTDFIEGRNLEEVLQERGPMDAPEACSIGIALCEALDAVHAAGMVHRDVKTSNVMMLADGSVVLIDFGSVKDLPHGVPAQTERIRGTPLATAPELLRGDPVARTADIYSLGVLLYRLVTGAYPVEARSLAELVERLDDWSITPLSKRRADLDPAFVQLVEKAMAKEPEARPPDAVSLRRKLMGVGEGRGG